MTKTVFAVGETGSNKKNKCTNVEHYMTYAGETIVPFLPFPEKNLQNDRVAQAPSLRGLGATTSHQMSFAHSRAVLACEMYTCSATGNGGDKEHGVTRKHRDYGTHQ